MQGTRCWEVNYLTGVDPSPYRGRPLIFPPLSPVRQMITLASP